MPNINHKNNIFKWPIVGNKHTQHYLQKIILKNTLHHSYLFVGPEGVGKKLTAEYFITSLLCREMKYNTDRKNLSIPCRKCVICKQLEKQIYPDFHCVELQEGKNEISIEQIRQLRDSLKESTLLNSYKIGLVVDAEFLSLSASNALLKILEEPNKNTIIILTVKEQELLLPTIVSRCQIIRFLPVGKEELFEHLTNLKIDRKLARQISDLSFGNPQRASEYLKDKNSLQEYQEKANHIFDIYTSGIDKIFLSEEKNNVSSICKKYLDNPYESFRILCSIFNDMLLIKSNNNNCITNKFLLPKLQTIAKNLEWEYLIRVLLLIQSYRIYLKTYVQTNLIFENLFFQISNI